jgi:O-antigen/teichoic acid export membrane protein
MISLISKLRNLTSDSTQRITELRSSKFAKDAALLLFLNLTSRAIGFIGSAYAARTLGPTFLGISGLIQTTSQQASLAFNGGFDNVAVRKIAANRDDCQSITATIVVFRSTLAVVASIIWIVVCYSLIEETQRSAWMMGVPLLFFFATNITFSFQGTEKLPIQNAINTIGVISSAFAFFLFFKPGMSLGSDLVVACVVGIFLMAASWMSYRRIFNSWPIGKISFQQLRRLLIESWRYWIMTVVIFIFSTFQISIIAYLLGPRETGIFRSAFLLAGGIEFLFNSINSLLLARLVTWRKLGLDVMWKQQTRLLRIFFGIGLPIIMLCIVLSHFVYQTLLGADFLEGIPIFQVLVIGRFVVFLGQIYSWGMTAIEHDTRLLIVFTIRALTSVGLTLLLIPLYGIMAAALVSLLSDIVIHLYFYFDLRLTIQKAGSTIADH